MKILLKGFVADGINEPVRRSILIENDRIIAVEKDIYGSCAADREYSFKSEIISPGFIDVHGHSDLSLAACPGAESKRRQGVTCEITGNCGLSPFPVNENNRAHLNSLYANYGIEVSWDDLRGYQQCISAKNPELRTFQLCGHNTLRSAVAGYEKKELSDAESDTLCRLLSETFEQGAVGISSGLLYSPGCFADQHEIIKLMQITAKYGKVYTTHLKSEGNDLLESLQSTLDAALQAGLKKVVISHLKTAGKANWHKLEAALDMIAHYRNAGVDVRFDRYPYTESQTMLSVILPPPFDTMPDRDITIAMQDEAIRKKLRQYLSKIDAEDWKRWRLTGTTHPEWKKFAGKKYTELPGSMIDAVIEQLTFDAATATIGAAGMSSENMLKIITSDLCMPGSDGNAVNPEFAKINPAHPRTFGAIAKFIRLKLDSGLSIGQAVAAATGKPAKFFNLPEIGTVEKNKKADITVFSPDDIDSKADFTAPDRFADGIKLTMLNGQIQFY
ncbi:MAG: amidohydrolase family protein [Lentisphaeria bacterium]|nr:amidohydrolase family protein [Lentisphaeria bacterium]